MEYRALGPLEVRDGGRSLALGGAKQRALLALLLINANRVVSRDRLIDEVWGEHPPETAVQSVQVYVSRLRKLLPPDALLTRPPGYLLSIEPEDLDLQRFESMLAGGRAALAEGNAERASDVLAGALALWRGPALAEFAYEPFAAAEIGRLDDLRLVATEERIDADLALGRQDDLIGELEGLIAQNPHRERLRGQLMLALYRSGRQAEALEAYRQARSTLSDELGIEPSAALQELERRILNHDAELEAPPRHARAAAVPAPVYRRPRVIGGVAIAVGAAIGVAVVVLGGDSSGKSLPRLSANSVGLVNPASGDIQSEVTDVPAPTSVASGANAIWVSSSANNNVTRIDADTHQLRQTIKVGDGPSGIAFGAGKVWVANSLSGTVSRIDPDANEVVGDPIRVGNAPTAVAFGHGAVWVTNVDDRSVSSIDPRTLRVRTFDVGAAGRGIATGAGALWVSDSAENRLVRVDPATSDVTQTIGVGSGPTAVGFGSGAVWVANTLDGTLSRIDPVTNAVRETIPVGASPVGVAAGAEGVWVADDAGRGVVHVDPTTGDIVDTVRTGARPTAVTLAGSLWVAAQASAATHRGGTLVVNMLAPLGENFDPPTTYDPTGWSILSLTNDGLVGFKRAGGGEGTQLVPDLAVSLPTPTDGGRTYRFQLRNGIRYSTGARLKASDVRRTFERLFGAESPRVDYYSNIVGGAKCARSLGGCDLRRGIAVDDDAGTVTFHLARPDAEFLYKLAIPFAYIIPGAYTAGSAIVGLEPPAPGCVSCAPGYPAAVVRPSAPARQPVELPVSPSVPATGPYMVSRFGHSRLRLVRNPRFHSWSEAARPDGFPNAIDIALNTPFQRAVDGVEGNRVDLDVALPGSEVAQFATQHPAQLHTTPNLETFYVFLNTSRPPFDNLQARRAVATALDRDALVDAAGGTEGAQATCQVLPPNLPGYRPYCPLARNVSKARLLVRSSGTRGARVAFWFYSAPSAEAETRRIMKTLFTTLGYRVSVKYFHSADDYYRALSRPRGTQPQAGTNAWVADYPAPSSSFAIVSCRKSNETAINASRFCSRTLDGEINSALALQSRDRAAAARLWTKIDRDATDTAAIVPMYTPRSVDLVSKRVGNYQRHPLFGALLDQLWVK